MNFIQILVVVIVVVLFVMLAIYLVGINVEKSTQDRLFNRWYCDTNPKSLPCAEYDYSSCTTLKYDDQMQTALNLGDLFISTVDLFDDIPGYELINSYKINPKKVKGEYEPLCYFFKQPNTTNGFIVVRGTDHLSGEWELDYHYGQVNFPYIKDDSIKVSKGFLKAYDYFRQRLIDDVKKNPQIKDIYVVGHSLGAGIVALLVADFAENLDKKLTVFNMAPPRPGNNSFVNYIENSKNILSYVSMINLSDIVPSLPPPLMYASAAGQTDEYSHVGKKVVFDLNYNSFTLNHATNLYVGVLSEMLGYKDCGKYVSLMT